MEDYHLSDSNIVITDKSMLEIYNPKKIDISDSSIIQYPEIYDLDFSATPEDILELKNRLKDHFFLIAGSPNFHHLDLANLIRLKSKFNKKIQLVTFDYHMDCGIFEPETNSIHCGNWVSYADHIGLIEKLVIIGSSDYRKFSSFSQSLNKQNKLLYEPRIDKSIDTCFLDPAQPTYISIDTDIVDEPTDWGRGRYRLDSILNSPVWEQLSNLNLIGACILGHVTDNRKFLDFLVHNFKKRKSPKTEYTLEQSYEYLVYSILPKLWASLTVRPLPLEKQLEIILAFHKKINSIKSS